MEQKTYIIAEIGINHNGDLNIAKKLIDLASVAGCDAVKFQKRNPDACVPEHQKNQIKSTPWGDITYLEYKHKVEFGKEEFDEIDRYCKGKIEWSASPWDLDSLKFLMDYNVPWIKVPSAMLTDKDLLKDCARWVINKNGGHHPSENTKKLIISTGMSTEDEIDDSIKFLQGYMWRESHASNHAKNLVIMHCNSSYPSSTKELNLDCILTLKEKFKKYTNILIGYSGHEFTLGTTVASIYLGASYVERHITLDRTMWGSDHMASVGPKGIIGLVSGIRELEDAYGDGKIRIYDSELEPRKKLRGY